MCTTFGSSKSLHLFKDLEDVIGEEELKKLIGEQDNNEDLENQNLNKNTEVKEKMELHNGVKASIGDVWNIKKNNYSNPDNKEDVITGLIVAINDGVISFLRLVEKSDIRHNDISINRKTKYYCSSRMLQYTFDNLLVNYKFSIDNDSLKGVFEKISNSLGIASYIGFSSSENSIKSPSEDEEQLLEEILAKDNEIEMLTTEIERLKSSISASANNSVSSSADEVDKLKEEINKLNKDLIAERKESLDKDKELIAKDKELIEKDKELNAKEKDFIRADAQLEIYKNLYEGLVAKK